MLAERGAGRGVEHELERGAGRDADVVRDAEYGGGAAVYFWRSVVSGLLFMLLWEWVRPLIELSHITDLHIVEPLLLAMGSFILLDVFRCPASLGWPLKVVVSLAIVGYFFHGQFIGELAWLAHYKNIVVSDVSKVLQGEFGLSAENRTLILFIGIALLVSVIQSLLLVWQTGGYFVAATFVYLLSLQLWAGIDTTGGIVRTFAFGMALLMLLNMVKIQRIFDVTFSLHSSVRRWVGASGLVLILTLGAGGSAALFADDEAPLSLWELRAESELGAGADASAGTGQGWLAQSKWVERLRSFALERQGGAMSTPASTRYAQAGVGLSGYGGNDHRLGGQVQLDEGIVFIAPYEEPVYWRGESKIYYDGKGWSDDKHLAKGAAEYYSYKNPQSAYFLQLPGELPERIKKLSVAVVAGEDDVLEQAMMIERYLKESYTYNIDDVQLAYEDMDFVDHFLFEQRFGYCDHFSTTMVVMLRSLGIPARWVKGFTTGDVMDVSYDELQQIIPDETKHGQPLWLQKMDAPAEQAQHALEAQRAGYREAQRELEAQHAAQRAAHFARVTGGADALANVGDDMPSHVTNSVVVRNLHAHSWVEAYIPTVGWLAFEPTPAIESGADDRVNRELALLASLEANTTDANAGRIRGAGVFSAVLKLMKKGVDAMSIAMPSGLALWEGMMDMSNVLFLGGGVVFVAMVIGLLFIGLRPRIVLWQALKQSRHSSEREKAAVYLFDALWVSVFKRFGPIQPSQTIREYAQSAQVRSASQRSALCHFAELYEAVRYDEQQIGRFTQNKIIEAWKKI